MRALQATWQRGLQRLNEGLAPARRWYESREPQERRALRWLAAVLAVFLFWFMVWQPLYQAREQARAEYISAAQTLAWISDNAAAVREARQNLDEAASSAGGDDWVSRISASASAHNVSLKGFTPEGSGSVRVMLENQSFVNVTAWLEGLRRDEGVRVANIEISEGNRPGGVNVRATLARGS